MAEAYNQDDRSLLSMLVDLLVAVPDRYKELQNYKFASEETPGVLCKSLLILVEVFSHVQWERYGLEERLDKMQEIAKEVGVQGEEGGIAAKSLEWAISNRRG